MLPTVAYGFISGEPATARVSLFEILLKEKPNRSESFLSPPEENGNDDEDYKRNKPTEQEKLVKAVRDNTKKWNRVIVRSRRKIKIAQEKQSVRKRVHHKGYKLNHLVMRKNYQKSDGKLRNYFQGPYVVVRQTGPVT